MALKEITSFGKYVAPPDVKKPYWVGVLWSERSRTVTQHSLTESEFFMMLGRVLGKYHPVCLDVEIDPS